MTIGLGPALTGLETQRAQLLAELIALNMPRHEPDRLLTVSVGPDWLYRHADEFCFTVRPRP